MLRKYTALFPFDVALWEDISHRTLAAFRQAFIQGPGTNFEVLASLDQSPSVLRFWKVSRVSLFTHELCICRGCIANWPGDLNYILCFLEDFLPPSQPTLLAHTSQDPLLSQAFLKLAMSELRAMTVRTSLWVILCSNAPSRWELSVLKTPFEPGLHKEWMHV